MLRAPGRLAAPLTIAGQQQWLVASGRRRDEPFDEADQALLKALAAVGNGALSNAELYQQVRLERERLSSITLNIGEGVCAIDADGICARALSVTSSRCITSRSSLSTSSGSWAPRRWCAGVTPPAG